MIPRRLRAQIGEVLRANVAEHSVEELAEILTEATGYSFTRSMTGYYMRLNGLNRSKVVKLPPEAEKYVLENYRGVGPSEMTARVISLFGCRYDVERMKGFYGRHRLDSGITGRFAPGHVPWTKGMKGYSPPGTEKTRFQKGHMPENHREVGSERIDKDGYTLVKVAEPNVWMLKHRLIWEAHNGPVPEGCAVVFRNQDKTDFRIENLMCITRGELGVMCRKYKFSEHPEINDTKVLLSRLIIRRRRRKRNAGTVYEETGRAREHEGKDL